MKKILYFILIFSAGILINSCDEDFLDRTPQDRISDPDFWKTEGDLRLFLNGFYGVFPSWEGGGGDPLKDLGTDILIESAQWYGGSSTPVLDGTRTVPTSGGGWNWYSVRRANYFIENAPRAEAFDMTDHYIGEGYFFRAYIYFGLLQRFGDLPIVTEVLNVGDEALYSARSPRSDVFDFILDDLDMAIEKLEFASNVTQGRVHKDMARLFKARACLYEGTWEKYHAGTDFAGSTDGETYLEEAAAAALAVINEGNYSLYSTGNPNQDFQDLFVKEDYSDNPEVLFYRQYAPSELGIGNSLWNQPNSQGITRSMTKYYLCEDGLPIGVSPLFVGDDSLPLLTVNRDSRLDQSVLVPGDLDYIDLAGDSVIFEYPAMVLVPTGYQQEKFYPKWIDPMYNHRSHGIGYINFRFAEALLIYAEAKAELGTITQADIDMTINKIRERVGMPDLVMSNIAVDPNWPDYGYTLTDILYEIRRERTVELFGEGFRLDDLLRWRAHELFVGTRPIGTYYSTLIKTEFPTEKVNNDGFLDPFREYLNGGLYGFNPARDYLFPLPTNQITLNDKLTQNPGW